MTLERDYLGKALDIALRLALIAVVLLGSFRVFSPFMLAVIWAAILAVTFYPLFERLRKWFGGRSKLTGSLMIAVSLVLVLAPVIWLTDSLLDATVRLVNQVEEGTLVVPPPTEKVKAWPVIGDKVYGVWVGASRDLEGTAEKLQPQLQRAGRRVISSVSGIGKGLLQTMFALVIGGILMITSEGVGRTARVVARKLGGDMGPAMLDTVVLTIRSVVKGVVLVALVQGLAAGVGLAIARVPGAGLWALLVMMLAVMQLPAIIILGPLVIWEFANQDSTALAVFFLIWSLIVSVLDNVLKPLFLGRGIKIPMLVILVGAIGGMLRSGLVGLFVGPVVLTVFYELFAAWVAEDGAEQSGSTSTS